MTKSSDHVTRDYRWRDQGLFMSDKDAWHVKNLFSSTQRQDAHNFYMAVTCATNAECVLQESIGDSEVTTDISNTFPSQPKRNRRPNTLYSNNVFESH